MKHLFRLRARVKIGLMILLMALLSLASIFVLKIAALHGTTAIQLTNELEESIQTVVEFVILSEQYVHTNAPADESYFQAVDLLQKEIELITIGDNNGGFESELRAYYQGQLQAIDVSLAELAGQTPLQDQLVLAETAVAANELLRKMHLLQSQLLRDSLTQFRLSSHLQLSLMILNLCAFGLLAFLMVRTLRRDRANLRKEKSRAEEYLAIAEAIIVGLDARGTITLINQHGCAVLGDTEERILGCNWFDTFVPEANRPAVKARFQALVDQSPPPAGSFENNVVTRSGQIKHIAWRNKVARKSDGSFAGTLSSGQDISDRKAVEDKLREREERFSLHLKNTPLAYIEFDSKYKVLDWNPAAQAMFGYSKEEIAGRDLASLIAPPEVREHVDQVMAGLLLNEGGFRSRNNNITKDGRLICCDWYNTPLLDDDGKVTAVASLVQDVTERIEIEAERTSLISELEARNAEMERFVYTVSHDLKAPLISIRGFLGWLQRDLAEGNEEEAAKDIHYINQGTEKMHRRLTDLLDLSRVGRLINPPETIPLDALAHETIKLLAGQYVDSGVKISILPNLPEVWGDRSRLLEVFQNLVENAAKYMGDQPEPWVEIGSEAHGSEHVIFIRDNGMGIEPKYQQRIFGLFERLSADGEGSGVGLALVRRIVEHHGGRVWVESQGLGHGCTFYFTLPKEPVDSPESAPNGAENRLKLQIESAAG